MMDVTGQQFKDSEVIILDREQSFFKKAANEAIYERFESPSLNKRGA